MPWSLHTTFLNALSVFFFFIFLPFCLFFFSFFFIFPFGFFFFLLTGTSRENAITKTNKKIKKKKNNAKIKNNHSQKQTNQKIKPAARRCGAAGREKPTHREWETKSVCTPLHVNREISMFSAINKIRSERRFGLSRSFFFFGGPAFLSWLECFCSAENIDKRASFRTSWKENRNFRIRPDSRRNGGWCACWVRSEWGN